MAWEFLGVKTGGQATETYRPETKDRTGEATEVWLYKSDDICNDTETTLALYMITQGHPEIGTESPSNYGFYCVARTFTLSDESGLGEVEIRYSTHPHGDGQSGSGGPKGQGGKGGGGTQDKPTLDVPPWASGKQWTWGVSTVELPMLTDVYQQPLVTPVGELISGHTYAHPVATLSIERYQQSFYGQAIQDFSQCVNASTFWGARQYEALLESISASQVTWRNLVAWKCTYQFKFLLRGDGGDGLPLGWRTIVPSYGTYGYAPGYGSTLYTSEAYLKTPHAWINSSGVMQAAPSSDTWFYRLGYRVKDFSALKLGIED